MDNSIKFTEHGTITVTTEIDNKHRQMIVRVKDTGKGISADILPKLFSKFVTKSEKGVGLGLYICIWAENHNEGIGGATFSFSLPLAIQGIKK